MLMDIPSGKAGEIFIKFAEPNYSFTRIGVKKKKKLDDQTERKSGVDQQKQISNRNDEDEMVSSVTKQACAKCESIA